MRAHAFRPAFAKDAGLAAFAALAALLASGCVFSPSFKSGTVNCKSDSECPAGVSLCREGLCVSEEPLPGGNPGSGGTTGGGGRGGDGGSIDARPGGSGGSASDGGTGAGGTGGARDTGMTMNDAETSTGLPDSGPADVPTMMDAPIDMTVDLGPPPPPKCAASKPGEAGVWVPGQGNCSYPVPPPGEAVAAVDRDLYANAATCGSCIEVTGMLGTVVARVVDQFPVTPNARGNRMTLSEMAFNKVARAGSGVAPVNWRWVPCQAMGSIMAALKDGSTQFYWEVILDNVTNRVAKLEYATLTDATWREVPREAYNYFRKPSANGLPSRLRLTDLVGNVQTTGTISWGNPVTKYVSLGVQFPVACTP